MGPDAGGYCMAEIGGLPVAGLGIAQNPGPPYWTTYISVADADAALTKSRTREAKFWLNRLMCSILAEWLFSWIQLAPSFRSGSR